MPVLHPDSSLVKIPVSQNRKNGSKTYLAYVNARCSDLILYPVNAVDQSDSYRFDYSDVSFGNTHSQGATVTITCTNNGQPATVEGYDQVELLILKEIN